MKITEEENVKILFNNGIINKRQLKDLMSRTFHNYGVVKSSIIADRVKNLTFHYATKSGISLSIEDLRIPQKKRSLIGLTNNEVESTEHNYEIGNITNIERFQKVIDIWNNASNFLKEEVITYFRESDPFNSLYIMAFSGARGNISQVRQLVGMRGLMADPQGQIIDLPIKSNFREGLTVTEYIISSYGARKGLVDTALRTADSGYLTRRLVDVAQDIIVREDDCGTQDGLLKAELVNETTPNLSVKDRMVGRLLAQPVTQNNNLVLPINSQLTSNLLDNLHELDIEQLKVRSPLTCNSIRSVCRNCYGWHLAYSKLVDLGEAIGIIAAQSIGEPGTQLTMRTFHTGGVFSGDLTQQIRAPFQGTLSYKTNEAASLVRTLHGTRSFLTKDVLTLYIKNLKGTCGKIKLPAGATLLVNTEKKVYTNQIIAEIKKDANLVLEEDSKTVYTNISGEVFFQNIEIETIIDKQGNSVQRNKNPGLIWVLHGKRYSLPRSSELVAKLGQVNTSVFTVAKKPILNTYSGIVKFRKTSTTDEIRILNFSLILRNAKILSNKLITEEKNILEFDNGKKFRIGIQHNNAIQDGETIATLINNPYKTETGGIVTYNIEKKFATKKRKGPGNRFSGTLYWIPEETHRIENLTLIGELKTKNNTFIKKGTNITSRICTKTSGILQVNVTGKEVSVKPGELFKVNSVAYNSLERINGFVEPGNEIMGGIIAQKLVYIEFFELHNIEYVLVRPVQKYKVAREKEFFLNQNFFPHPQNQNFKIKTVKKIFLKNWEHVKSSGPVELLNTFLNLDIKVNQPKLQVQFEILRKNNNIYQLQVSQYEILKIDDLITSYSNAHNIKIATRFLVNKNQYVTNLSTLAQLEIFLPINGTLGAIKNNTTNVNELLILQDKNIRPVPHFSKPEKLNVKVGELVRIGTKLSEDIKSEYSGQIYKIDKTNVYIRLGRPYLISQGAILEVKSGSLVQRLDKLATLIYEKLKTVDIVQGLPKVEEILEARKIKNPCILAPHEGYVNVRKSKIEVTSDKGYITSINFNQRDKIRFSNGSYVKLIEPLTDGPISPHEKLEILFNYYYYFEKLTINEACRQSFRELQLFLVNEVQRTYLSQGVQIADKHIEIIIKQMTSKVRIEDSGDTILLPGELLNLYQVEIITKSSLAVNEQAPFYTPLLLGITKASLNSDSFISAASFQETTRVLTEAAIEGKKDWLHGLKENVIIGRLIPAGTGFKYYKDLELQTDKPNTVVQTQTANIKDAVLRSRFNQLLEKQEDMLDF
uniref:RNA polymerase b''-subunit n=1 Tax=Phaeocystis rex TaxID=1631189 RepID=UPI0024114B3B|nr:RNA polymerase b''-subunit [Phaeocystis rex]WEL35976.1 RNA polymerase b''-subunit [Phaeocystis rex]